MKRLAAALFASCTLLAQAATPGPDDNTRVLAMGDSLTSGYGATPNTNGYAYRIYNEGLYDRVSNTTFANSAVPGATSAHVLQYQVPMALASGYQPNVIAMTVGGNDLRTVVDGADPVAVLMGFQSNFVQILMQLCFALPDTKIYVGNLYVIRNFPVDAAPLVGAYNSIVSGVTAFANAGPCGGRVKVADVYSEFAGPQEGLLLINRPGANPLEIHPTNAGYQAMARAFEKAAQ